jgi:WD40 repeat protein
MNTRSLIVALLLAVALLPNCATADEPTPQDEVKERYVLRGHADAVTCVTFLDKGKILASGSSDKTVKLWDMATGKELATLEGHEQRIQAIAGTAEGKMLASGDDDGLVKVWDAAAHKELRALAKQKGAIQALRFSPDGKILASGGGGYDKKADKPWSELKLWDPETGKEIASLEGHDTSVTSLAFAPDGKTMASCSADGSVILWDVAGTKKKADLGKNPQGGSSVVFSPDGKTVACGSFTKSTVVKFWDVASAKETKEIADPNSPCALSLAFFPDGKRIAMAGLSTNTIRDPDTRGCYLAIWDVATGKEVMALKGHKRAVIALALSADEKLLASGGLDQTVRVWQFSGTSPP